ncbi:MAG TPA: TonB-dependent receptor, partial [Sphingobacterium sp.]|nr:TonB-dependent receptor [Sphingobacterium sp.]
MKIKIGSVALWAICQLFLNNVVFAQNTVVGIVRDTADRPISAVSVRLVTDLDTFNQVTDDMGAYKFDRVRGNTLYLTFNMLGYKAGYQSMFVLKNHSIVEVPKVELEPMNFIIKDVNIVRVIPIVITEDTIQFNFDAYKFRPNSLLEEAIKDLPGFSVTRDGSVYFNGKRIPRVQVDNKDFFGGNLLTATRNLPTSFIQNLQVIDYYGNTDEATGLKSGEPEKIINITLKPDKKEIYFGQITLGGGTNKRYLGSFGVNKFNDGQEVSIIGSTNNTNTNMFYLGGLSGGDRRKSLQDIGDYAEPVDGLNRVSAIGINLSDQLNKTFSLTASYNFLDQQNITDGFSQLISSYVGNTIRRKEDYVLNTNEANHNFKFGLSGKFSNRDQMKVNGNFIFNSQKTFNVKSTEITNAQQSNRGSYRDATEFTSPNGSLDMVYSKYFSNPDRKLVGEFRFRSNSLLREERVNEQYLEIGHVSTNGDRSVYLQDQWINQNNVTNSAQASLTFVEPFADFGRFEFNYTFDITGIDAIRSVYDKLNEQNPSYIDSLALNYAYYFKNNHMGLSYHMDANDRVKFNIGFAMEPITLRGKLLLDGTDYTYENINLMPSANLSYKISKELDWQFNYRGKNNQPN